MIRKPRRIGARQARRAEHLAWLESAMAENAARLAEIRERREAPCPECVAAGFVSPEQRTKENR